MFDVFKIGGNGEPILLEAVQSLEDAMGRVIVLRESLPCDYVVVSQVTGKKYHSPPRAGYNEPDGILENSRPMLSASASMKLRISKSRNQFLPSPLAFGFTELTVGIVREQFLYSSTVSNVRP